MLSGVWLWATLCAVQTTGPAPVVIDPEPMAIKPGAALGARVLVSTPAELNGAASWTIDSRRHRGPMLTMAVSPDGSLVATGGRDGTVRIWDFQSGRLLRVLIAHGSHHNNAIGDLAWSHCGNVLAVPAYYDGVIRLWDPRTGQLLKVLKGLKGYVGRVAWSPDGTRLAAAGYPSGWVATWTIGEKSFSLLKEFGQGVYCLHWSPDSKRLAVCGVELPLLVMDVATRSAAYTLGKNLDVFTVAQWSPDGKSLAAGGAAITGVWALAGAAKSFIETPTRALAGRCSALAWSPDGKSVATTSGAAPVQIWDAVSGKAGARIAADAIKLQWHADGRQLAGLSAHRFSRWSVQAGKAERLIEVAAAESSSPVWTANRPIITGIGTNSLVLWDSSAARQLQRLATPGASVSEVAWSRDGKVLAGVCSDAAIRLWNASSGAVQQTLKGYKGAVYSPAWSPDGKMLAAAGSDGAVRVWDRNGESVREFAGHKKLARLVAWTPGGLTLASASDDQTIAFWGLKAAEPLRKMRLDNPTYAFDFTAVGKTMALACSTSRALSVYNAVTGQVLVSMPQSAGSIATTLAWAPSGGLLLVGRSTEALSLLDPAEKKGIRTYHTAGSVRYGDWTPNGATVVAGSVDRTVQFFDAQSAALRGTILEDEGGVTLISSDGHWRSDPDKSPNLVYIAQTLDRQITLAPAEFAAKFGWRNNPVRVKLTPR